jgi:site-specific DNA-methyltransferase (adenine-specific)
MSSSNKGDSVLDPFVGSGSTGIICSILKRKFIGIDISKEYLDLAIKRFKDKEKKSLIFYPEDGNRITNYI